MKISVIDELYKELLIAQLDKNWGKVAKIQLEIWRHPEYYDDVYERSNSEVEEGSRKVEQNKTDLWYFK